MIKIEERKIYKVATAEEYLSNKNIDYRIYIMLLQESTFTIIIDILIQEIFVKIKNTIVNV